MCTNPRKITVDKEEYTVKCGKCFQCRRERQQDWTIKLINEAKYHKESCFITLTFSNQILNDRNSKAYEYGATPNFIFNIQNSKIYFQKFIKRLRKKFKEKRITYYHVGEYGEKFHRPHHHVLLFGINFHEDRKEAEKSKSGYIQYYSDTLEKLWAAGRTRIQDVNNNNISYIAAYSLKKFKNNQLNKKYKAIQSFSNRSKMNCKFIRKHPELITKGYLTDSDGKKYRIPKSYKDNLKKENIPIYQHYYLLYENKLMEWISRTNPKEQIEHEKNKEIIYMKRTEYKKRSDF